MKQFKDMRQAELTSYVQETLERQGIHVVFSGGSAASFYSDNKLSLFHF
jgi:hypothetical protein